MCIYTKELKKIGERKNRIVSYEFIFSRPEITKILLGSRLKKKNKKKVCVLRLRRKFSPGSYKKGKGISSDLRRWLLLLKSKAQFKVPDRPKCVHTLCCILTKGSTYGKDWIPACRILCGNRCGCQRVKFFICISTHSEIWIFNPVYIDIGGDCLWLLYMYLGKPFEDEAV